MDFEGQFLQQLVGVAATQGQSAPSDLNLVRANLVVYERLRALGTDLQDLNGAVKALDASSTRLYVVNIVISVVAATLTFVQVWLAVR